VMTSVVTDLVGKRVTVRDWTVGYEMLRATITGIVRGVASSSDATFTLLLQVEVCHLGWPRVGALTVVTLNADNPPEIVPEP